MPCEEACPVKAISKDEYGIEHIDESKCIFCGKCLNACPFGAIFEISQAFDVLKAIRNNEKVVAIVAPAVLSQFDATKEQVYGAFLQIGFNDVIEVAQGAMTTVSTEGHELLEKARRRTGVHDHIMLSVIHRVGQQAYPCHEALRILYRISDVLCRTNRKGEASGC